MATGNNQYGGKPTEEEFNKKLKNRGIKYILTGKYTNARTKTQFYCEEHNHYFDAIPSNVLKENTKCPMCTGSKRTDWTTESINMFFEENDRKIKLLSEFKNIRKDGNFYCEVCEYTWETKVKIVLYGCGCPQCSQRIHYTFESFNNKMEEDGRTVRVIGPYSTQDKRTTFKCLICDYEWKTQPRCVMIRGSGCPCCAKHGFDSSKSGIVYYIKITHDNNIYYKIGITNRTIEERFKKCEMKRIEKLFTIYFENGNDAYNYEQNLLKEYVDYRYSGKPILKSGGNTEIFIKDIFEGNYEQINYI